MNSGSYSQVLKIQGVQPFLWMQFLNAFNDNVYKLVVSLIAVLVVSNGRSGTYLSLAGFIFVAPFLLFSGYAGQLADCFEKRTVIIVTKAIEIFAMLLACLALISGNIDYMLAVLFLTATQAALFSPAKYGIVPELVEDRHLARANGLLEMSTFVAIILGTVAGTLLVARWKHRPLAIGAVLVAIAIIGTLTSLRIRHTPAPSARSTFSWSPLGDVATGLRRLAKDRDLLVTVLGTTYFWFLGALFQMLLLLFGKEALHATESQTGLLLMSLALGIGIGSMAAGRLSGDHIEPGLVPIGGVGMAAASFALAFCTHSRAGALVSLGALGFMGGLFVVPLNAILQHRPQAEERGRILATANFLNTVGMMLASGMIWLLHEALHVSAAGIAGISAALTLAAAVMSLYLTPHFFVRILLVMLTRLIYRPRVTGRGNVPRRGGALLVSNHVSFVDGFLVGAAVNRFVRFMVDETWYDRFALPLSMFHAIRVPGHGPRSVVKAIELARRELQAGHLVCIFAEGTLTLNGNTGEFHRGLEKIVHGLEVPVIPIHLGGVWGSIFSRDRRASLWRSIRRLPFPISVSFGQPMRNPQAAEVRQEVSELGAVAAEAAIKADDSLVLRFIRSARQHWRRRALTDSTGRVLTYGEALTVSTLLAKRLARMYPQEERIGILLPASVAAATVNLATVLAGRIPVNLNFTSGREAVDSAIEQASLKVIVTSKKFLASGRIESRPGMILIEDLIRFSRLAKANAYMRARLLPARLVADSRAKATDLAAILFSSGSTGIPKGVMLSHRNLLSNADSVNSLFQVDSRDTIAGALPLFHSFGFTYALWFPLLNGASAAYHPQPLDAKAMGDLVQRTKATFLLGAPTFCQAYVRTCTKEQFATLQHVLVGAEKLNPALARAFLDKFGVPLLEGYGATEMSPVISVNVPESGTRAGTVGQPVPGVAAKVVHRETGEPVACGGEGLLLVKGPNRMLGYPNQPAETAAVLRDGWYVTGDIVTLDPDGFIRMVDRESRFSKIGGEMVPHAKVEQVLQTVAAGAQCVVTSLPDARRGERMMALVASGSLSPQQLWQGLMDSGLPKIWIPKVDDIRIVDQLPLLGSGKVDLRAVKLQLVSA